jgi:integrase
VDDLRAKGLAASSVHNKLDVLRVTFRRALRNEDVTVDPFTRLELPPVRHAPRQVADPARATALLDALPDEDRALWAVLLYAGLRVSEARALRWDDVDFDNHELRVRRGWDDVEGELDEAKTEAGRREVPLAGRLRSELARHKLATGRGGRDLCFGRPPRPRTGPRSVAARVRRRAGATCATWSPRARGASGSRPARMP